MKKIMNTDLINSVFNDHINVAKETLESIAQKLKKPQKHTKSIEWRNNFLVW